MADEIELFDLDIPTTPTPLVSYKPWPARVVDETLAKLSAMCTAFLRHIKSLPKD